jgi:hypothetical protein
MLHQSRQLYTHLSLSAVFGADVCRAVRYGIVFIRWAVGARPARQPTHWSIGYYTNGWFLLLHLE